VLPRTVGRHFTKACAQNNIGLNFIAQLVVQEIQRHQHSLQRVNALQTYFLRLVLLKGYASQMVPSEPPDSHVLVASSNKLQVVKWEKLESKYWVVPEVSEGQRPVLFPAKHLHAEHSVHADRYQLRAIRGKRHVQDSSFVRSFENHNRLESLSVPYVDRRMNSYFSGRDKSPRRVLLNTRNF
jgi:hypothetical protein